MVGGFGGAVGMDFVAAGNDVLVFEIEGGEMGHTDKDDGYQVGLCQ